MSEPVGNFANYISMGVFLKQNHSSSIFNCKASLNLSYVVIYRQTFPSSIEPSHIKETAIGLSIKMP
jgi:hypothetical protein